MENNRPVFESFDQFVQFVYEAVQLNEAESESYAGKLAGILSGGMKLKGDDKTKSDILVADYLNKYYASSVEGGKLMVDSVIEDLEEAFNSLNNEKISTKQGSVTRILVPTTFKYLTDGVVKAEGHPVSDLKDIENGSAIGPLVNDVETLPLGLLLAAVNAHNFEAFATLVRQAAKEKNGDKLINYGDEANMKGFEQWTEGASNDMRFIQIDDKSLSGDTIQFTKYTTIGTAAGYGWQFPIYVASTIIPGGGNNIDSSVYDEVIQPAGNSVEVTEKEYNSSGIDFFEENAVEISEAGKKALNSILSQYNSIDKIVVKGGASSKPTSRKGGNEQLAKDRQAAGISLLNALKKSGVAQLKATAVTAGEAKVQDAAASESDPKNQQVSFIISGKIKSTEVVENKPVIIEQVEKMKADGVKFAKYTFSILVTAEPNNKNMSA